MTDKPTAVWFGRLSSLGKFLLICLALNFFFVSIKLLGAFKDLGSGYGEELIIQLANNPLIGLLIGVLVTSIAQSSSMTTSLVVGLAAAGALGSEPLLVLARAIPIILGANVGTTITNMIVSIAHIGNKREFERAFSAAVVHDFFNLLAIVVIFPVQATTNFLGHASLWLSRLFVHSGGDTFPSPLKALIDPQKKFLIGVFSNLEWITLLILFTVSAAFFLSMVFLIKRLNEEKDIWTITLAISFLFALLGTAVYRHADVVFRPETAIFIFGLGLLFTSLTLFVKVMRTAVLSKWTSLFDEYIFKTPLRALSLGVVMTALVQSSSVTTSIVIPLAGAGILTIHQIFPYTLGANVGTTITAMLAALSTGETIAVAVAFAHLLFNIIGIVLLYPVKRFPIACAQWLARLTLRSRVIPVLYIIVLFFVIPLLLIWITG
jgi:sodium-dependent phosphate cotransporter